MSILSNIAGVMMFMIELLVSTVLRIACWRAFNIVQDVRTGRGFAWVEAKWSGKAFADGFPVWVFCVLVIDLRGVNVGIGILPVEVFEDDSLDGAGGVGWKAVRGEFNKRWRDPVEGWRDSRFGFWFLARVRKLT